MRKIGICGCATGIAIIVSIISICGIKSIQTKVVSDDTVDTNIEETFNSLVEQTEIESSNSEPETEQNIYTSGNNMSDILSVLSPTTEQRIYTSDEVYGYINGELSHATWLFMKSAENYVIYEYEYRGDMPQTEIVVPEDFDHESMCRALCAIENFCGTDFRIVDTYYVGSGGMVQFEYDNHEYTCMSNYISGHLQICDRVISELETEQSIDTADMSDDFWKHIKSAWLFIESVEDYVIYEYRYRPDDSQKIVVVPEGFDCVSMFRAMYAIEDFCGSTDFRIVDTYYVGLVGMVQFEYDGHEYTCIADNLSSYYLQICDKVFEHNYTPRMSDDYWELREAAFAFIELAEDYVIYEYKYRGDMPQTEIVVLEESESREDVPQTAIVVSEETIDYASMSIAVCAIEDFCGTDFCIVDTYYVGSGGNVQFEYNNHEYTCITEGVSGEMKICDKVFEVSPTSDRKVPYVPSEIKICD